MLSVTYVDLCSRIYLSFLELKIMVCIRFISWQLCFHCVHVMKKRFVAFGKFSTYQSSPVATAAAAGCAGSP